MRLQIDSNQAVEHESNVGLSQTDNFIIKVINNNNSSFIPCEIKFLTLFCWLLVFHIFVYQVLNIVFPRISIL